MFCFNTRVEYTTWAIIQGRAFSENAIYLDEVLVNCRSEAGKVLAQLYDPPFRIEFRKQSKAGLKYSFFCLAAVHRSVGVLHFEILHPENFEVRKY